MKKIVLIKKYGKKGNRMKKFLAEFKAFALRGNVLDMAVGIIIGSAFTAIVKSLTDTFIQPLLNWILPTEDLPWFGTFAGFVTTVINFIVTAFVLFLIIKGINLLMSIGKKKEEAAAPSTKICPYCKSEIALEASRCPHCTSNLDD